MSRHPFTGLTKKGRALLLVTSVGRSESYAEDGHGVALQRARPAPNYSPRWNPVALRGNERMMFNLHKLWRIAERHGERGRAAFLRHMAAVPHV